MKQVSRFVFLLLLSSALGHPHAVWAAAGGQGPAASVAKAAPGGVDSRAGGESKSPVARPLSAWLVGPSQASRFDAKEHPDQQGCLMVTEYDNGMIVGVHARASGIVGMTVDTKKASWSKGQAQTVGLALGHDSYALDAVASDDSTLAFALDGAGGGSKVSARLTDLGNFRLLMGGKPYYFATTGFSDGLARLQACMGGTMAVTVPVTGRGATEGKITRGEDALDSMKVESSGTDTPLVLAMPELVPSGYRFVLDDIDPMTPVSWQAGGAWADVMRKALGAQNLKMSVKDRTVTVTRRVDGAEPVLEADESGKAANKEQAVAEVRAVPPRVNGDDETRKAPAESPVGVWGGAAGERLGDVLEAWGLMAGVKVKTDLEGDLKLPRDVRYEGRFDDAVQNLLALFGGRNRPVGRYMGNTLSSALTSPAPVAIMADAPPRAEAAPQPLEPEVKETKAPWKPRSPGELRAMAREAQAKWGAPLEQMEAIPDPSAAPKTVAAKSKAKVSSAAAGNATWKALEGTSLRDVFEQWGQSAGVRVVWLADQTFPLPDTVRKKGSFEDAVLAALATYENQKTRPVAQLNSDPGTGEKALIVKAGRK